MVANTSYRWSFIWAMLLHIILFAFLFVKLSSHHYYTPYKTNVNIINAVTISENQVNKTIEENRQKQQQILEQQAEIIKKQQAQAQAQVEQQRIAEEQKQIAARKKKEQDLALAKQKQAEEAELKIKKEREQKQQQAKRYDLAQKTMEEQLDSEQRQVEAAAQAAQTQGEIDKYKALILQSIAQYWIVPDNIDNGIYCQLLVRVAPGGEVLSVELTRSSGNAVLDRSAKTAVLKASPLPVPTDQTLFDEFRELKLTVRPEGVTAG